jgi:hypothetical protein
VLVIQTRLTALGLRASLLFDHHCRGLTVGIEKIFCTEFQRRILIGDPGFTDRQVSILRRRAIFQVRPKVDCLLRIDYPIGL